MARTYVVGDIHGQYGKLVRLLRDAALVDAGLAWVGGQACLWFIGDYFDRGPDGIASVDLIRRLQGEAAAAGGQVGALLGNHDVLILAARRFGSRHSGGERGTFFEDWLANGGLPKDLAGLTPERVTWLQALPAMALVDDTLLVHADALFYLRYGRTIAEVNDGLRELLVRGQVWAWDQLLDNFGDRRAYLDDGGAGRARDFLAGYGGQRVVHGHTPISKVTGRPAPQVTRPYVYADGLCINVDGGMYLGSPGFIYTLS